jgi:hypothetical protein
VSLRQYRKGLLPHVVEKFYELEREVEKKATGEKGQTRKRRRM